MTEVKLSSHEVPEKFADWLLSMGFPPERLPTVDKISQMCRGRYYTVWRSLMEQVESKDVIKQKRLQVFADDVRECKEKNLFTDHDTNVLIPPELTLWRERRDIRKKVLEAETRVMDARRDLNEIMDKVSIKMAQRNRVRQHVQDAQRRGWLLQLLAEDLRSKKDGLIEMRSIAEEMCTVPEHTDVQAKLDRCLSSQRGQPAANVASAASSTMISNPSASVVSSSDIDEDIVTQLVQCRGDALWAELNVRRFALVKLLDSEGDPTADNNRPSYKVILMETAALQCTLTLEAYKCREMTRLAQERLAQAVNTLNTQLSSETCELLVLHCERSRADALVNAKRDLLQEISSAGGLFATSSIIEDACPAIAAIHQIDKAIVSKREELESVIASLGVIEQKTQNVRECLTAIFNGFQNDGQSADISSTKGLQLDLPSESIACLRQFYEQRRGGIMKLSMDVDVSDNSFNDLSDLKNARFIDELRIYLKKFSLEKNRKLVLESGEKIWIFETLQSSANHLQTRWQAADIACGLSCPSQSLPYSMQRLANAIRLRGQRRIVPTVKELYFNFDINKHINEEDQIIDKVKKRLNENLRSLANAIETRSREREP